MKNHILLLICLFSFAAQSDPPEPATPQPQEQIEALDIGSSAPKFDPEKWYQNKSFGRFGDKKIVVFELWATWCSACRSHIPLMNELNKKFGEKVEFVAVAAFEQGSPSEQWSGLETFMNGDEGKSIEYFVAFDSTGKIASEWSGAAGERHIPHVFVVDEKGQILFIGSPQALTEVLPKIISGAATAPAQLELSKKARHLERAENALAGKQYQFLEKKEWEEALKVAEEGMALMGPREAWFKLDVADLLIRRLGRVDEGLNYAIQSLDQNLQIPQFIASVLSLIIDPHVPKEKRNYQLAKVLADHIEGKFGPGTQGSQGQLQSYLPAIVEFAAQDRDFKRAISLQKAILAELEEKLQTSGPHYQKLLDLREMRRSCEQEANKS